jgi:hypothetical protein
VFARLDELGLEVVGQRLEPARAVLAFRVPEPDRWCRRPPRGREKLNNLLAVNDPTLQIAAAWGVKEQLRRLMACTTMAEAARELALFNQCVTWPAMPETCRRSHRSHGCPSQSEPLRVNLTGQVVFRLPLP